MITRISTLLIFCISLLSSASVYAQELQEARQGYYFGFGPGFFGHYNSDKLGSVITPGVTWSLDRDFDLAIVSDIGFSLSHNDVRYIAPQLKGRYVFLDEDTFGYYAGMGLGYGYAHTHESPGMPDDSASGFASSFAIGIKGYRNSSVQVSLELEQTFIWNTSTSGRPQMTFLKVGVHFF